MRIGLSEGFSLIPKGSHVFKIVAVDYNETFGKMKITMQTAKGQKHEERFSLLKGDNEVNEGALNAFSYFAKTALNDYTLTEIDHKDLIGHYIRCEVDHEDVPRKDNLAQTITFVRLGTKTPAEGFDKPAVANSTNNDKTTPPATNTPQNGAQSVTEGGGKKPPFNLDNLLG